MEMNNKFKWIGLGLSGVLLTGVVGGTLVYATQTSTNYIGEQKAESIALEHAGVTSSDVSFIYSKLDNDDFNVEYDVEFWAGNVEYDYEIDAKTGTILSYDHDAEYNYAPPSNTSEQNYIGEEKAKIIALEHAGLNESEVSFALSKFDLDDGFPEYEVEFFNGTTEYDYEIDAVTGEIRGYDYDMESIIAVNQEPVTSNNAVVNQEPVASNNTVATTTEVNYITEEEAKNIALNDAGVSLADVSRLKCEFDYDDGRSEYEVEWEIGRMEYEYTISATDGTIWERDIEQDD